MAASGALSTVSLGRLAGRDSYTINPTTLGAEALSACAEAPGEQITLDLALFELNFWGARRAPETRDALVHVTYPPSWPSDQPRTVHFVQQLGFGQAVLDACASNAEFLWYCSSCRRWTATSCAGCREEFSTPEGPKRKRTGKVTCPQQPLGTRMGRLRPFFRISTDLAIDVEVSLWEQIRTLASALHWRPLSAHIQVQLVPTGAAKTWATEADETPTTNPFVQVTHVDAGEDCKPLEDLIPGAEPSVHRPAQAAAVAWAMQRDQFGKWDTGRQMLLPCHPQCDSAIQLSLHATYQCRGGVLAQSMGTGKTLAALCIIAARPDQEPVRPMAPDLHCVSCTLILAAVSNVAEGTWQHDASRHLSALKPPFKLLTVEKPQQLGKITLAELDSLDALILPQNALDWVCFQKGMANPPLLETTTDTERCEHLRRCLHFQKSKGAKISADIRADQGRASRWTLADVGPVGVRWGRLIVDELPELLVEKPRTFGKALLQAVEAPRRWGITATPKLDSQGLQAVCDFLRVSTAGGLTEHWSQVVRELFRGGEWDTAAIHVTHVTHRIRLTGLERAVYESEYARAHTSSNSERLASCVRKCTHWHDIADNTDDDALSLPKACERSLAALNRLIEDRAREVSDSSPGGAAYVAEVSRMREEELARLRAQGKYVSAVFSAMTTSPCEECPICLTRFTGTEVRLITPCGHVFHEACLNDAQVEGRPLNCPSCRAPVLQLLPLRCPLPGTGSSNHVALQPIKMRPQSGEQLTSSKIAYLASFLKNHSNEWLATRGELGKVLVLVQWSVLRLHLEEALCAEAVPFVAHRGHMPEARDNLQAFLRDELDSPVVLLATFERRLGINVQTVASHLVLVHPFVALEGNSGLRREQAEEQALARLVRPGQKRPVFFHRFVGADTLEEAMIAVPPEAWHRKETRDA